MPGVAQLVKRLTLDFSSGRDLTVHVFEPCIWFDTDSTEPASDSLSPSLSAPPLFVHSHFLHINKLNNNNKEFYDELDIHGGYRGGSLQV